MKVIGLTGGVGMGKSTAAGLLLQAGVRVVDTDELARKLVEPGQPALEQIRTKFGPGMISSAGELRRDELACLVFADPAARQKLEAILHPRIREMWQRQLEVWRSENCLLAAVVIPLLFETQAEGSFDKIICVACTPATQRERLHARGWNTEQASHRIAAQMPVEQKMARSHFVIWTEGLVENHRQQIGEILKRL